MKQLIPPIDSDQMFELNNIYDLGEKIFSEAEIIDFAMFSV